MSTLVGLDFVTYPSTVTTGETAKFTFGKCLLNDYWATLEYKFGSYNNGTDFGTADGTIFTKQKNITSRSWVVSGTTLLTNLLSKIPSATSGTWTLRLSTYLTSSATTPVETTCVRFTLKVGADIKPTVSGTSVSIAKPYTESGMNYLLTGVSALSVLITGSGSYSSTITRRLARLENGQGQFVRNISGTSALITVSDLTAGEYSLVRSLVYDSRGRTSEYYEPSTDIEFEVLEYYQPTLSTVTAERVKLVDGQYVPDPVNGQYARVRASMTPGPNRFSYGNAPIKVTVTSVDEQYEGIFYIANNTDTVLKDGNSQDVVFSLKKGYKIRFEALDTVVANASYGLVPNAMMSALNSTVALMSGRDYAKGVAFGKYAEADNLFEIEPLWDIKKKGSIEADFITSEDVAEAGQDEWNVIKTNNGLKIGFRTKTFTNVTFNQAGIIYSSAMNVIAGLPFEPTCAFASVETGSVNNTGTHSKWVLFSRVNHHSSDNGSISLAFGSADGTAEPTLNITLLIIGF